LRWKTGWPEQLPLFIKGIPQFSKNSPNAKKIHTLAPPNFRKLLASMLQPIDPSNRTSLRACFRSRIVRALCAVLAAATVTPLVLPALAAAPQSMPSSRTALTADVNRPDRAASRVFLPPTYLKNSSIDYPTASSQSAAIEGDTLVIGSRWDAAAYVYTRTVDGAWTRQARLQPLNSGGINGDFGVSVAIDGDTIVVGADTEAGSITSTMDSPNTLTNYAGAAYVFTRSVDGVWTQAAYLKASNAEYDDEFGYGVAIDGDTIVVEATYEDGSYTSTMDSPNNFAADTGAAYVFTRSVTGGWRQAAYLKTPVGLGSSNNALALEDNTIVFGVPWEDGSYTSTVGSPNNLAAQAGAAYVFMRDLAGTWTQAAYLKASNAEAWDGFGRSVALSGDTIVVGAEQEAGSVTSTLGSPNNAATSAGAAYVYTRSEAGTWTQAAYLKASNANAGDWFGWSVALSGDTMVVGAGSEAGSVTSTVGSPNNLATQAGAAYVYTRSGDGTWTQAAYLKAPNAEAGDWFGGSVALSGDTIMVGAYGEDGSYTSTLGSPNNAATSAGAAYVFRILSTDASLSGLALSAGALTPEFVSTTTSYAANVANAIASVVVTPTTNDASATYTVSNAAGVCAVDACALDVGDNTITITVTAEDDVSTQNYTVVVTRAAAPTPTATPVATNTPTATPVATNTPTATPVATNTPTATPGGPIATPTSVPPSPTPIPEDPYVSPSYGPPTTSTVSIISPAGGLTGATRVSVNGVKMFHVVRTDRRIDFTMKAVVAVAGTTVDVVLVKAGGVVMTFTQAYSFQAPTTVTGTTASGAVLTTTSGVTVTVPPQTSLRPAAPQIAGSIVITYAQVDTPAEPPGDVPLSFFEVSMDVDGVGVITLTHPATLELPVDAAMVPPGQRPWLFEWIAVGGRWSAVPSQTYDPATGLVTAPTNRLGTYVLVTAAMRWNYFPQVGNIYAPLDSRK
jgi:hypothetical protein